MAIKIIITVENDCVQVEPPAPSVPETHLPAPVARHLPGCAFFRKYLASAQQSSSGIIADPAFKDITIYTVGIVDNPLVNGYMHRHYGFNHNQVTGELDLSTLDLHPGSLVFVSGEWK